MFSRSPCRRPAHADDEKIKTRLPKHQSENRARAYDAHTFSQQDSKMLFMRYSIFEKGQEGAEPGRNLGIRLFALALREAFNEASGSTFFSNRAAAGRFADNGWN